MTYRVEISPEAEWNYTKCYNYIRTRNAAGADRWANAFYAALKTLETNPFRGVAPEDEHHKEEIRQLMFKTSAGLTYRALFIIRDDTVLILHIRGPGQDIMRPDEVIIPDDESAE